ncbi:MAG TPA: biotin transporter BioY [Cyanobacteria bacterium UBA11149]|nr:biotin transporter BioY [Cyanobacteria bacterium UBA11367]HBE58508.1 biotin transporter BioY [Cyanobacteria bacterium UBA11366]HBK66579.1 biotin transporter BioY [Cyanobacteria bacterium UBA11166]HBR72930.1 biotin transporter BioY [Cyanobacteria bacterium UBA11159]HBW89289.1 biotin transporter BioY [Cyanobacteria bacterium UBA11149]HCA97427.1 biotin transporter BioY [Cyanobacteria bacterium UBA9226]
MSAPNELIWALIGLLLTIGGTFLEAFVTNPPWDWFTHGLQTVSLGVTCQIGAVLLAGCLGGKNAGALSQIAYIVIGLNLPVFDQGGGLGYLKEPSFGYLLGFIAGAWVCGFLSFRMPPRLESLAFSCICGLFTVHIYGLAYLLVFHLIFNWASLGSLSLIEAILKYSIYPFPGQLVVVCAVTVVAFGLRQVLFY